jgi:hypothetical protein
MILATVLVFQSLKAQDDMLFRRHIVYSGINGLFYGGALDIILELQGGASAGVPVIAAGTAALIPLLTNSSKTITENSLVLSGHGKVIGWSHGFAMATFIGGENAWFDNNYKLTIGLGAITSIGLGYLGNRLGKNINWTDGQVALYRHYGWIGPFTGISISAAFSDEPRFYGGSVLLLGAGGYLLADEIYKWNEYTRGDIRATQVLSMLNGGLAYGIATDMADQGDPERSTLLIPAIGVLSGTFLGHLWLKNTKLTAKQGLSTAYAATGGAILGLGIALFTESHSATPYYVIPYITGMGAFALTVESLRRKNEIQKPFPALQKNNLEISLMPQNLFLNEKMQNKGYMVNGRYIGMQPLFAASLVF